MRREGCSFGVGLGWLAAALLWSTAVVACSDEDADPGMETPDGGDVPAPDGGTPTPDGGGDVPVPVELCKPADSAEPMPARADAMSADASSGEQVYFVRDLYGQFRSFCGGCHVDTGLGSFRVNEETFPRLFGPEQIAVIKSDDPDVYMPPPGSGANALPWSERSENDPVRELVRLAEIWVSQGSRPDFFLLPREVAPGESPYVLPRDVGEGLTNIGDCVPEAELVQQRDEDEALDAFFAGLEDLEDLPERLEQTDLVTFDHELLAELGLIAYAPTYPLWSDDAGKLRHIRLPKGTSVQYNAVTGEFDFPPNTRFYKTFLRKVIQADGSIGWRKIETRIIVSRPDILLPDGSYQAASLFGTYVWSDDEKEAILLRDPLRNGEPFRDRLVTYVTDEQEFETSYRLALADGVALNELSNLTRTYPVPGASRCVQCHMGSETHNWVLGFSPLQLNRRPLGEGGVIDAAGPDELTQLQRFIDYGIVTGLTSPDQVVKLEDSQGTRRARNDYELDAQGYLLGNCAHCHNPVGFPSVQFPVLRDLLDFRPSEAGGVFQFPVDRVSPRIRRGATQGTSIGYITPVLRDGFAQGSIPKSDSVPWLSLLYRNVDSRQTYEDDFAIYPHMPQHIPGFDCRAPAVLGSWVASIPANVPANAFVGTEVKPGEPGYEESLRAAETRLFLFEQSPRILECRNSRDTLRANVLTTTDQGDVFQPELDANGVPQFPNWIITDTTDAPGEWLPRRPDWEEVLVHLDLETLDPEDPGQAELRGLLEQLRAIEVTDALREAALEVVPFSRWATEGKEGRCDFTDAPKASDYTGDARPIWFDEEAPPPGSPIYEASRGDLMFQIICSNCHGRNGDSQSGLADTILQLTGGDTRVANLRDGLFGPTTAPGEHMGRVFGDEDLAARYLLWMALGGTQRLIPFSVLRVVGATTIAGKARQAAIGSANMLSLAENICAGLIPAGQDGAGYRFDNVTFNAVQGRFNNYDPRLIGSIGDAALWQRLCTVDNPAPVMVIRVNSGTNQEVFQRLDPVSYGANPVAGPGGRVFTGVTPDNVMPYCISGTTTVAREFATANGLPLCPSGVRIWRNPDLDPWVRRAAMNAGLAVFVYLQEVLAGRAQPYVRYDECERAFPVGG